MAQKLATLGGDERLAFVFQNMVESGQVLALLVRYEGSFHRLHDRAARQLDLLRIQLLRNEPNDEPDRPLLITACWVDSPPEAARLAEKTS